VGTNYYWRETCANACEHCGLEPFHVGKSSAGWSFGFRAYRHELMSPENPDWGYGHESPFGFPVRSRADWMKVFTERTGALVDEYGREIDDPLVWLGKLPPPDTVQQAKEWSPQWMGPYWRRDPEREWRDAEGFRFLAEEFS
jgi:hypothetical protein